MRAMPSSSPNRPDWKAWACAAWMPMPRWMIASTPSLAAIRSITSGIVSRVSPPARSIGLLRLQRGGTSLSMAARRSSGSGINSRPCSAQASAAMTPQPPAVVKTSVRGPLGSGCVANVAAHSKASSTVGARRTPACAATPSKTPSSLASDPVWLAAARFPSAATPPFTITSGLRSLTKRAASAKRRPSGSPSR